MMQPFMQLPSVPTCSPVKTLLQRNVIVKETCSSVGDVITEELPSVNIAIDFHATNMEQTAANEFRLKPAVIVSPPVELPTDLQSSATSESEHGSHENPVSIVELSDADVSYNVSLRSSHVAYDHDVPQRVRKHRYPKMMYPPNCVESPGTSNDPDYIPDLVELSEQRQIEIACTEELESHLFNFNLFLKSLDGGNKGDDHAKQIVQDVKRIFQALEMKKLEDFFVKNNFRNKYQKGLLS